MPDPDELHPQARAVLDTLDDLDLLPYSQYSVERARAVAEQLRTDAAGPDLADVGDRTVPGPEGDLPVRTYRPAGEGPFPAVVYFHGGGFVLGGLDSHDLVCRHLAREADAVVMAVDYRLAPEHPFPAAVRDAYAATTWTAAHPDELGTDGRLAVAGDSAGGTLAAVIALLARDRGGPELSHQALVYPGTSPESDWPSREENAEGYFLETVDIEWFYDHYVPTDIHARNPYAFPMNACDFAGLPPATVVSAGFDPLRDEDEAYADRLAGAGVAVEHRAYPDVMHGFWSMLADPADLDRAHEAVTDVAADLRASFERTDE
jgi:acetyl esterase